VSEDSIVDLRSDTVTKPNHENAKRLAEGLAAIEGITLVPEKVVSNIVIFDAQKTGQPARDLCRLLGERGILASATEKYAIRAVTHYDVTGEGIEHALGVMSFILRSQN
jgi:threonine aldolase